MSGELLKYFKTNKGRQIHKWIHYFEIYEKHFERFRGRSPRILEIGVQHGGGLQMWASYFGKGSQVFGVDIDKRCLALKEDGFEIVIGDQADPKFWDEIKMRFPQFDVIIEDGGHEVHQQLVTFDAMFPHVSDGGVFLCEDTHSNYWKSHGGGFRKPGTFIEFSKSLVDQLNAWHSRDHESLVPDYYTENISSIHFYDSIVVFEKKARERPHDEMTGTASWGAEQRHTQRAEFVAPDQAAAPDVFTQLNNELASTRVKLEDARETVRIANEELNDARERIRIADEELTLVRQSERELRSSTSWRATAFLRTISRLLGR